MGLCLGYMGGEEECTGLEMTNLVSWPREWRKSELTGGAKSANGSGQKGLGKRVAMFSSAMATHPTMEKWVHLNKLHVFRNPLRPIPDLTTSPSNPAVREPIFIALPIDLLRKIRVMMEDVNVSNVREGWIQRFGRHSEPTIHRG
jgi:hypothetical protein